MNWAFGLAVLLNSGFIIFEIIYALAANSMSLLADAGHNFGDVLGLIFAWSTNLLLAKSATERFSYGFKKTTILAALMNALILVGASAILVVEAIRKLIHTQAVHEPTIIVVAFIGILINGGTALLFLSGRDEDLNVKGAFLHLAYDALLALGVVLTGIFIWYTKWYWLDPAVSLLIVLAIITSTWGLLRNSVNLIMDAVPPNIDQKGVKEYLTQLAGVSKVHDLHIWALSTHEVALTAHLVMPAVALHDADYERINHDL
jgi:cobalt-zinc-cadmium efflux system protein